MPKNTVKKKRNLSGWRRQPHDPRDYRLSLPKGFKAVPTSVDLSKSCSDVEDQGELGSCTANGFAGIIELNQIRAGRKLETLKAVTLPTVSVANVKTTTKGVTTFTTTITPAAPAPAPTPQPATTKLIQVGRLAHYYFTRDIMGTINEDSGATIRDTIKAGVQFGVSDESLWPYRVSKFMTRPNDTVYETAAQHKVSSYHSIADGDIATMKAALADGLGVIFGFDVYDYFLSAEMETKGMLSVPTRSERWQGGHCVVKVGYDDNVGPFPDGTLGGFLCRNSWGKSWGLSGYFWMSYSYIQARGLASDNWVVLTSPI